MDRWAADLEDAARYASRKVGWRVPAEDVLQELVMKLLAKDVDVEAKGGRPYLFTSAKNTAIDMARRLRDVPVSFQESVEPSHGAQLLRTRPSTDPGPLGALLTKVDVDTVRTHVGAILGLLTGPGYKAVAILYYLDGQETREIAEHLGKSEAAIRKKLQRAREQVEPWVGDLAIWREYKHPGARRPEGTPVASEALRNLVG